MSMAEAEGVSPRDDKEAGRPGLARGDLLTSAGPLLPERHSLWAHPLANIASAAPIQLKAQDRASTQDVKS